MNSNLSHQFQLFSININSNLSPRYPQPAAANLCDIKCPEKFYCIRSSCCEAVASSRRSLSLRSFSLGGFPLRFFFNGPKGDQLTPYS